MNNSTLLPVKVVTNLIWATGMFFGMDKLLNKH